MTIKTLGAKRLQGLKLDRVSDSLGSSADGTNYSVTIPNTVGEFTTVSSVGNLLYSGRRYGCKLVSGNSAIGKSATGLAFKITDANYPSGEVFYYKVYRSDNGSGDADTSWTQVATTSGIPESELTGSNVFLEKSFTSPVTLAVNDVVCIEADDVGSSSAYISLAFNSSSTNISSANVKGASRMQGESDQFTTTTSGTEATPFKILGNPTKLGTGCYKFNGSSGYTSASISSALQSQEKVSIAFWYKRSSSQSSYSCMFSVSNNVDKYKLEIANDNSSLWIYMSNNSSAVSGYGAISDYTTKFPVDTWVHVAYVYDGSQSDNAGRLKLYINGSETTLAFSGTVEATTPSSLSLPLDIGRRGYGGGTFYEYGQVDDMGIWTRALSATEIQALVNNVDKTANFTSDFSSSTGWTEAGAGTATIDVNTSTEKIDWAIRTDGSDNNRLWYDLQSSNALGSGNNASDDKWVLRFKWTPTFPANSDGTQPMIFCMLAATGNADRTIEDDCIGFVAWNSSNNNYRRGLDVNDDLWGDGNSNMEFIQTAYGNSNINGDEWVEIKRNSTTSYTVSFYSDEFVTLRHSMTRTASGISGITNLRYIKFAHRVDDSTPSGHPSGTIEDVKFWNNVDQAYDTNGALVSSLADKSELKVYYSMNSLDLDVAKTYEDYFNYADQSAGDTKWVRNDTSTNKMRYNNTNKNLDFNYDQDNSNDSIGTDLGSNLNDSSWVIRFKLVISSLTSGASSDVYIGMSSVSETSSAGTSQQFIGVDLKNEPSDQKFGGNDGSSGTLVRAPQDGTANGSLSTGTYYMQITRLTATTYTIKIFDDSDYSNLLYTVDGTSDSITSLRYFVLRVREASGSAVIQGTIDDLEIWDGTTLLGCQNDYSSTSALDAFTGIRTNTIFEQTDATATTLSDLNSSMILYYNFKETAGVTLNDQVGSVDGELKDGSLVNVDSPTGRGWRFDDTKVQIDQSLGTVSNISLSIWVKKFDGDRCPIAIDSSTSNFGNGIWFEDAGGSNGLRIGHQASGNGTDSNSTTHIPQDGEFHHVVFNAWSGGSEIYLDGTLLANSNTGSHSSGAYGGALELAYNGSSSAYGNCALDEARWFNKRLSQAEVTALYKNPDRFYWWYDGTDWVAGA